MAIVTRTSVDAGVTLENAVANLVGGYVNKLNSVAAGLDTKGGDVDLRKVQGVEAKVGYIILLTNKAQQDGTRIKVGVTVYYKDVFIADIDKALEAEFSAVEAPRFRADSSLERDICDALKEAQYRAIQRQR